MAEPARSAGDVDGPDDVVGGSDHIAAMLARPPGERGSLVIADRVLARIASSAAAAVPGVERRPAALGGRLGTSLPTAHPSRAGDRVSCSVEVATRWGAPLAPTAARVRSAVAARLGDLTGYAVDTVDVTVAAVVSGLPSEQLGRVR